jgi:hypothetical protein
MTLSVRVHSDTATGTAADFSNTAWYSSVTLTNTSASAVLWARLDGTAAVVSADNNYVIPAGTTRTFRNHSAPTEPAIAFTGTTPLSLIASASCTFTVEFN